jgi:hypothetical protein
VGGKAFDYFMACTLLITELSESRLMPGRVTIASSPSAAELKLIVWKQCAQDWERHVSRICEFKKRSPNQPKLLTGYPRITTLANTALELTWEERRNSIYRKNPSTVFTCLPISIQES